MNEKIRAWINQKIKDGSAIVSPAGTHVVPEPLHSFSDRLNACRDILELAGFANRRRYAPNLPKWNEEQRSAILLRKMEMEKQGKKK
tara:strand:- start:146 stop:406 length:261 start_codon:yes stop_codon:yes gene_type:complete